MDIENMTVNELKEINKKTMDYNLFTPDKIYLDLALIKDINLGTMFSYAKSKGIHEKFHIHVMKHIKEYKSRIFNDIYHYLKIGFNKEKVNAYFKDTKNHNDIFIRSPFTDMMFKIQQDLQLNINHSSVKGKSDIIELNINLYPLQISDKLKKLLGNYLTKYLHINVRIFYLDMETADYEKDFSEYDCLYIYYIKEFTANKSILKALNDFKFKKAYAFFYPTGFNEYVSDYNEKKSTVEVAAAQTIYSVVFKEFKLLSQEICSVNIPKEKNEKDPPTDRKEDSSNGTN